MKTLLLRLWQKRVLLVRPNTEAYGHLGLEILVALNLARDAGASLYLVRPTHVVSEPLLQVDSTEVKIIRGPAWLVWALNVTWWISRVWPDKVVYPFRLWLRDVSRSRRLSKQTRARVKRLDARLFGTRAYLESVPAKRRPAGYYQRVVMRHRMPTLPSPELAKEAESRAREFGITPETKLVTLHVREAGFKLGREVVDLKVSTRDDSTRNAHIENYFPSIDYLVSQGYTVVRIGDPSMTPVQRQGVVDLATSPLRSQAVEVWCLLRSAFLIAAEAGPCGVSYLTNTPCLAVNATDPISSYPIRDDGLYITKRVIDRISGKELSLAEMLTDDHMGHLRDKERYDYVENSPEEILAAVTEMLEGLTHGWNESPLQTRFRALVRGAAIRGMERYSYIRKWGTDFGFLGDGRIAQSFVSERLGDVDEALPELRDAEHLKILFVMSHLGFVRNYDPVLRRLAQRGHRIHMVYERDRPALDEMLLAERLCEAESNITFGKAPDRSGDLWTNVATMLRACQDYLRYFEPKYAKADGLRKRVEPTMPKVLRSTAQLAARLGAPGRRGLTACLKIAQRSIPSTRLVKDFLKEQDPDLVLLTPLVEVGAAQDDYAWAARELGIRTALGVASWDNLTNKGLMRVIPDRIFVWNEVQKAEAVEFHGAPADRVTVTGAQIFDHWFDWKPSCSREAFCQKVGLDADKPFILYLGSSFFISPEDAGFGARWISAIRAHSDPALAQAGVLIRPHPKNGAQWSEIDFGRWPNVGIWPSPEACRWGGTWFSYEFMEDFYDSMHYSIAVVGANTSAQIEAGILDRPVYTLLAPEFAQGQGGTLHFEHLANADGGLVRVAKDMDEHLTDLSDRIHGRNQDPEKCRRFIETFVRPHGLDRAATPFLATGIEDLAAMPAKAPERTPGWGYVLRPLLFPLGAGLKLSWEVERAAKKRGRHWLIGLRIVILQKNGGFKPFRKRIAHIRQQTRRTIQELPRTIVRLARSMAGGPRSKRALKKARAGIMLGSRLRNVKAGIMLGSRLRNVKARIMLRSRLRKVKARIMLRVKRPSRAPASLGSAPAAWEVKVESNGHGTPAPHLNGTTGRVKAGVGTVSSSPKISSDDT